MIGAVQRGSVTANSSTEDVACYTMWKPVDFNNDLNVVENNLCHGSRVKDSYSPSHHVNTLITRPGSLIT
jgi:hypothetical protein